MFHRHSVPDLGQGVLVFPWNRNFQNACSLGQSGGGEAIRRFGTWVIRMHNGLRYVIGTVIEAELFFHRGPRCDGWRLMAGTWPAQAALRERSDSVA